MKILVVIVISYLIGSFSSAFLIGKIFRNIDIRYYGSGNSGATNALRVMGFKLGALTFVFDVLKGIITILLARNILPSASGDMIAGLFAVIGHNWPIFIKFKGGKGVATSAGVLLMLNWHSFLLAALFGITIVIISKYVSLGSMVFLLSNPLIYLLGSKHLNKAINYELLIFYIILALMSLIRHKDNIKRLVNGNENKLGR